MANDANIYHVTLDDGTTYTVTTEYHHDNHIWDVFAGHLLDIIKNTISNVLSRRVDSFIFKGRK